MMQFGIFDWVEANDALSPQEIYEHKLQLAAAADKAGFHGMFLAEHQGTPLSIDASPAVLLAAMFQRTQRLRAGALTFCLPWYDPYRFYNEVCMLDQLSGGRFQLGVGRGGQPAEHSRFGLAEVDLGPMFEEALELLLRGLAGESLAHQGRYYTLPDVPLRIRPLQQPHPPLWYGTGSSHRNQWAAEHSVNLLCLVPNARAGEVFDDYQEKLERLGKLGPGAPFWGLARQLVIAPTDAEAERIAARAWKRFVRSFNWLVDHLGREPFPIAQDFPGAVSMGLAFAGSPASVRDWVASAHDEAGITYMALEIAFGDITEAEAAQSAELFAREVMPAFAADPV